MAKSKTPKLVDLGKKPEKPVMVPAEAASKADPKFYYPSLYVSGVEGLNLPDGVFNFTGRGKRVSETERTNKDGQKEYSCEIEIQALGVDPADQSKKPDNAEEDAQDGGADDAEEEASPGYTPDSGDKLDSSLQKISDSKNSGLMDSVPNDGGEVQHTTI